MITPILPKLSTCLSTDTGEKRTPAASPPCPQREARRGRTAPPRSRGSFRPPICTEAVTAAGSPGLHLRIMPVASRGFAAENRPFSPFYPQSCTQAAQPFPEALGERRGGASERRPHTPPRGAAIIIFLHCTSAAAGASDAPPPHHLLRICLTTNHREDPRPSPGSFFTRTSRRAPPHEQPSPA